MREMTIVHNGGGWLTNIGNAFLDLGSTESLRQAFPNADIHVTSVMNRWVSHHVRKGIMDRIRKKNPCLLNTFNIQEHSKADYVVQAGACLGKHWFNLHGDLLQRLSDRGVRIVINGGGMTDSTYSESEIAETRRILKKIKPFALISRETETFDNYSDLAEHSYDGIDCAFFVSDRYKPLALSCSNILALNFDKGPEPPDIVSNSNEFSIVRTHHSFWHNFNLIDYPRMIREYYFRESTMISETPYDYLDIYAGASLVISDRVHACVATLAFGNRARLYSDTPRARLFERVGAESVLNRPTAIDMEYLAEEKKRQCNFLREVLT